MRPRNQDLQKITNEVRAWPGVSEHPHRFGGVEFRYGRAEIGHMHQGGTVDIPYPRSIHHELRARALVEDHRWVPDSGWSTFHIRSGHDLSRAVWLMRLSYLRYALKDAPNASEMLEREAGRLELPEPIRKLLEQFVGRGPLSQKRELTGQ